MTCHYRKLLLILWKNAIFRRRHFFTCFFELCLPLILSVGLIWWNRNLFGSLRPDRTNSSSVHQPSTDVPTASGLEYTQDEMIENLLSRITSNVSNVIGFSPGSGVAKSISERFQEELELLSGANFSNLVRNFTNEEEMEEFCLEVQKDRYSTQRKVHFLFGIVFEEGLSEDELGKKVSYKIRPNWDKLQTNELLNRSVENDTDFDSSKIYRESGVLGVQLVLDRVLMREMSSGRNQWNIQISLKGFPRRYTDLNDSASFKEVEETFQQLFLRIILTLWLIFTFFLPVPTIIFDLVTEKQSGMKEMLKMAGLPEWANWLGCFLAWFGLLIITVAFITMCFFTGSGDNPAILNYSSVELPWLILIVQGLWTCTYCFLISSFFNNVVLALTVGVLLWFVPYFGIAVGIEFHEISNATILASCFLPNVGLHLILCSICALERTGEGAKWDNIHEISPGTRIPPILHVFLMIILGSIVNLLICFYLEAVLPKKFGVRRSPFFIFTEWGKCCCSRKTTKVTPDESKSSMELEPSTENEVEDDRANYKELGLAVEFSVQRITQMEPSEPYLKSEVALEKYPQEGQNESEVRSPFEEEPEGLLPSIEIVNLRKDFGKKIALDDLTVNIFKGEIFCLLGENGAGITTALSILTGMTSPTSGTAKINGFDIMEMSQIRKNLGYCPQDNLLFEELTVMEHLKCFGVAKGLAFSEASIEGLDLLKEFNLEEKSNDLPKKLNQSEKRKLQLACALIGKPEVLILDHPFIRLDQEDRKAICNILWSQKEGKTIILSTHCMEEASFLGGRIGILIDGKLQCCGSPSFLKKFYGIGFSLEITTNEGADRKKILETVENHVEGAYFKESLLIALPTEDTSIFPALLKELREKEEELKIEGIRVEKSSQEDVFIKVEELCHRKLFEYDVEGSRYYPDTTKPTRENLLFQINYGSTSGDLIVVPFQEKPKPEETHSIENEAITEESPYKTDRLQQSWGLLMKNLLLLSRRKLLILQILFLLLITIVIVLAGSSLLKLPKDDLKKPPQKRLELTLESYNDKNLIIPFYSNNSKTGRAYARGLGLYKKQDMAKNVSSGEEFEAYLETISGQNDSERYVVAAEIYETPNLFLDTNLTAIAWHSNTALHSAPLSLNLLTNAILRARMGVLDSYQIKASIHPLIDNLPKPSKILLYPGQDFYKENGMFFSGVLILWSVAMAVFVASFVIDPTEERVSNGKLLQFMTGINPIQYWSSYFLIDFCLTVIVIFGVLGIVFIFEKDRIFSNNGGLWILFLVFFVYSIPAIFFCYVCSIYAKSPQKGFKWVICTHIIAGTGLALVTCFVQFCNGHQLILLLLNVFGRVFPGFGFSRALASYARVSFLNLECLSIPEQYLDIVCRWDFDVNATEIGEEDLGKALRCCENCKELNNSLDYPCFEQIPYFKWTEKAYLDSQFVPEKVNSSEMDDTSVIVSGLSFDLLALVVLAVIYFVLLMLIECGVKIKRRDKINRVHPSSNVEDEDVIEERERVKFMVYNGLTDEDALVVSKMNIGNYQGVNDLSFGVHYGERFGLLEMNGNGTMLKILTGEEKLTSGDAFLGGLSLSKERNKFRSRFGYCPQFDGVIEGLTGKEMLCLFGRLRGLKGNELQEGADKYMEGAGIKEIANVQCRKYSKGSKRNLRVAIALIGDPTVIIFDELTNGMDPATKRKLWKLISSMENSRQAVILTSNSVEECERICDRLGIIINGEMQCFGGVQHLKDKFVQGYTLTVKLSEELAHSRKLGPLGEMVTEPLPVEENETASFQISQVTNLSRPQSSHRQDSEDSEMESIQQQSTLNAIQQSEEGAAFTDNPEVDEVIQSIIDTYDLSTFEDLYMGILKFQIQNDIEKAPLTWDELYERMETTKNSQEGKIESYFIAETSLGDAVLTFAKTRHDFKTIPEVKKEHKM